VFEAKSINRVNYLSGQQILGSSKQNKPSLIETRYLTLLH